MKNERFIKNTGVLTAAAMLTGVAVVLGFFKISITEILEIRFESVPVAVAGALLGPGVGAAVGALSDIGGYIVRPTGPFFPGFTLSALITGLIYGLILHPKNAGVLVSAPDGKGIAAKARATGIGFGFTFSLSKIIIAELFHTLLIGIVLKSLWLSMLYGNAFYAVLAARIAKELIMFPLNCFILMAILPTVRKVAPRFMMR